LPPNVKLERNLIHKNILEMSNPLKSQKHTRFINKNDYNDTNRNRNYGHANNTLDDNSNYPQVSSHPHQQHHQHYYHYNNNSLPVPFHRDIVNTMEQTQPVAPIFQLQQKTSSDSVGIASDDNNDVNRNDDLYPESQFSDNINQKNKKAMYRNKNNKKHLFDPQNREDNYLHNNTKKKRTDTF